MLVPLSWLKEYVKIDENISISELGNKLFATGFEVEEIKYLGEGIENVVVCKLLSKEKHPNADRLFVCDVDVGTDRPLTIVTNSKTVEVGMLVPVALDNAKLRNHPDRLHCTTIKGVFSEGMFCSGEEFGIDNGWYDGAGEDKVLEIKENVAVGTDIVLALGLSEYVLDITITANRPDCQSIIGIAKETAAIFGEKMKMPCCDYVSVKGDYNYPLDVTVKAPELCPRYMGHYVSNVKIAPSPVWMRRRLIACGVNAINNIVDITNYLLLEFGQPMHAFDSRDIVGEHIIVRRAENGEKIIPLNEVEYTLSNENLVICDTEKPLALAGIMGGKNSGIREDTSAIVFEVAKFGRDNIRKSSRSLGITSESSSKFSKGISEFYMTFAMKRALHLIEKLNCGIVTDIEKDVCSHTSCGANVMKTTADKINSVLGIKVPTDKIREILLSLEFGVKQAGDELELTIPPYREDIEDFPDISEEVIRLYGYDKIEPTMLKNAIVTSGGFTKAQKLRTKFKYLLVGLGYYEIENYSFYSRKDLIDLGYKEGDICFDKAFPVLNPLSVDYDIMRTSLAPSMLKCIVNNAKRANKKGRFFEIASSFAYDETNAQGFPSEKPTVCLGAYGEDESFFTVRSTIDEIARVYELKISYKACEKPFTHPGMTASIFLNGKEIGYLGKLSYQKMDFFNVALPVFIAEIDYNAMLDEVLKREMKYEPIAVYPYQERDLALVVPKDTLYGDLYSAIRGTSELITDVTLFDVYRGKQLKKGYVSMAVRIVFTPTLEKPLEATDVDRMVADILTALQPLDITLRS